MVIYLQKDQLLYYIFQIFHLNQSIILSLLLNLNNHLTRQIINKKQLITSLKLKNIYIGFQDTQHQQILRKIDIIVYLRFQLQQNYHLKLKKLNIKQQLQSQMLYQTIMLQWMFILLIQQLLLVIKEQLINYYFTVTNYLSQQFLNLLK
ncbi:unnamed protein product [Paramecium primaurelia]|uniref:Transmembrane protein n=1 Tax=Paramecium primaurelia TaxID=5886 RepID=A0A8S1MA82_PARPR|nr:unnamed protein product [Paramecium primaurelia]